MSETHYRGILKATSLIGGSSAINILIGMVRTKFVAVLLGPTGVGLMGVYTSITGMAGVVAGMGISTSGVRQIAEAYAGKEERVVARTATTLRRTVWVTGALGFLVMGVLAWPLSKLTFGSFREAFNLTLLGSTILLGSVTAGQTCLLQGMRRIKDLATVGVLSAINGTVISIPCFYWWGEKGIVPSLILCSAAGLATAWWFARRVPIQPVEMTWKESRGEGLLLLRFGFPLMLSGLFGVVSAYLINLALVRQVGMGGVGLYQAAFTMSGMLANFVLNAMGTDYYPRLTAVAQDPDRVRQEINAQTEIALLLATPALAMTLIFAPWAIKVFYSGRFDGAIEILRWAVFGIFGRVVVWPLGYLILAKGRGTLFLVSEVLTGLIHLALIWECTRRWGLRGAGIAFVLLYGVCAVWLYAVCTHLNRRLWNRASLLHVVGLGGALVLVGASVLMGTRELWRWVASLSICGAVSAYCLWRLSTQTGLTLQSLKQRFGGGKDGA